MHCDLIAISFFINLFLEESHRTLCINCANYTYLKLQRLELQGVFHLFACKGGMILFFHVKLYRGGLCIFKAENITEKNGINRSHMDSETFILPKQLLYVLLKSADHMTEDYLLRTLALNILMYCSMVVVLENMKIYTV